MFSGADGKVSSDAEAPFFVALENFLTVEYRCGEDAQLFALEHAPAFASSAGVDVEQASVGASRGTCVWATGVGALALRSLCARCALGVRSVCVCGGWSTRRPSRLPGWTSTWSSAVCISAECPLCGMPSCDDDAQGCVCVFAVCLRRPLLPGSSASWVRGRAVSLPLDLTCAPCRFASPHPLLTSLEIGGALLKRWAGGSGCGSGCGNGGRWQWWKGGTGGVT